MKRSGYGKRPLWFWLLAYGAVGLVAYGIIYLAFFNGGASAGGGY